MTNEEIIIIYKKIGTDAEFRKIKNEQKSFKDLVGGELDYIPYEDITIIARKNREHLKPNIYINTEFLSIGSSIRGDVVIVCRENENLKSLSKEQAIKYREFLQRASFNYDNFDEKGRYILNSKQNSLKSKGKLIIEKGIGENDIVSTTIDNNECFETNETLKMILGIQSIILKFIKDNSN